MSHEIRTPLNGILGMAELMGRCNLDETGRRYLDQIRNSGSTLLAILNDVLDLAKIDNGMLAIDPIRTNLYQLFQDIMGLYTGKAMEKNVSLMVDIDAVVPKWAMIDPTRLRQIVGNLISNAVKFTENGEVFVHIGAGIGQNGHEDLIVSVRDTGIGISPEQQSALFERFAQAEAGTAQIRRHRPWPVDHASALHADAWQHLAGQPSRQGSPSPCACPRTARRGPDLGQHGLGGRRPHHPLGLCAAGGRTHPDQGGPAHPVFCLPCRSQGGFGAGQHAGPVRPDHRRGA
jgi:hypothetical protein